MSKDYSGPADACEAVSWPAIAINLQGPAAPKLIVKGRMLLRGWSLQNGNAAAQTFQILDGEDLTGLSVAINNLAAGATWQGPPADTAILLTMGVFVVVPAGPLNGAVYVTPISGVRGEFGPGQRGH